MIEIINFKNDRFMELKEEEMMKVEGGLIPALPAVAIKGLKIVAGVTAVAITGLGIYTGYKEKMAELEKKYGK